MVLDELRRGNNGENMGESGLIGAVLYAKDLNRLVDFYASVTGLEPQTAETAYAVLGARLQQLVIARIPKRIADTIDIATPPEPRADTPLKFVFAVADLAHARERAAELGGLVNPVQREWEFEGAKVCDGHDPEGNIFQVRQAG